VIRGSVGRTNFLAGVAGCPPWPCHAGLFSDRLEYELKYACEVQRVTITIDKATLDLIRRRVGPRGVSQFIAEAARDRAGRNELLEYLQELDEKYGRPPLKEFARVDRELRKHFGMPPPMKPWNPYEDPNLQSLPTRAAPKTTRSTTPKTTKTTKAITATKATKATSGLTSRGLTKTRGERKNRR